MLTELPSIASFGQRVEGTETTPRAMPHETSARRMHCPRSLNTRTASPFEIERLSASEGCSLMLAVCWSVSALFPNVEFILSSFFGEIISSGNRLANA